MEQNLQTVIELINNNTHLSQEEKAALLSPLKQVDKKITITEFKLERTEKVKRTTATLLEETIQELEHKRKAVELQNRELEIEASLERVRAVAMGMNKAEDMLDVCKIISQQLELLNVKEVRNVQTAIFYKEKGTYMNFEYYAKHNNIFITETIYSNNEKHAEFAENMQKGNGQSFELNITDVKEWIAYQKTTNVFIDDFLYSAPSLNYYWYSLGPVALGISTYQPLSSADKTLFGRFVKVFELAYRRYLDIEQAEEQAREAQIELSLERVRAKTMAMHNSADVGETAAAMVDELKKLGVETLRCGIGIMHEPGDMEVWTASTNKNGKIDMVIGWLDMHMHPLLEGAFKSWRNKNESYFYDLKGKDLLNYYNAINNYPGYPIRYDVSSLPTQIHHNEFYFAEGTLFAFSLQQLTGEQTKIFMRFAGVFGQTYRRYLDLKKAEAQARESQIQLALERVRARTMAMQQSDELADAAQLLFNQVKELGIQPWTSGFQLWDEDRKAVTVWTSTKGGLLPPFRLPATEDPFMLHVVDAVQRGETFYVEEIGGEVLVQHYRYMYSLPSLVQFLKTTNVEGLDAPPTFQVNHAAFFSHGFMLFITHAPVPEAHDIFKRFAKVFEQTYTRFLDLQKAEAQALEAIKRASVDRVRAEIASMRTTADLERITPLIWNELTTLGVPFVRCGVFIMDEEAEQTHAFLSTPGGKAIATLHVPFSFNLALTRNAASHWRQKKVYQEHWDKANFVQSWQALAALNKSAISFVQEEQLPENLYLHLLPFVQGMLYVGSEVPLTEDALQLCQNLADAFATAYARYEDFNKLEAAKQEVDSALNKLQATQKQLIQSEKMASLGELTAGIAHEIQNPLNFVNNFSEVSNELIEELLGEKAKTERDEQFEEELLADIKQNLEKINHHGKRADAIVKGMLQHSRKSEGVKEPTDINALADEYLRLSYHGLRAKDKTFNATLHTNYDEGIGKINIIPQDIGRVLLNLFNNAFYAVTEKKKGRDLEGFSSDLQGLQAYEPNVTVNTKLIKPRLGPARDGTDGGVGVSISVTDNGNGIPQKIIDKIFQPFFTTKPTGQGTGLGLSLSYDIIKAHGGEIKVETKEGVGCIFKIVLPV